jgi:hypothetical protein
MGGKHGLRFTVYDRASYLASGMTKDEILKDFPYLEKEDLPGEGRLPSGIRILCQHSGEDHRA